MGLEPSLFFTPYNIIGYDESLKALSEQDY